MLQLIKKDRSVGFVFFEHFDTDNRVLNKYRGGYMLKLSKGIPVLLAAMAAALVPAHSYVIDGSLSDWGVTPFTTASAWAPTGASTDWAGGVGENGFGGPNNTVGLSGFGGEYFDVESA